MGDPDGVLGQREAIRGNRKSSKYGLWLLMISQSWLIGCDKGTAVTSGVGRGTRQGHTGIYTIHNNSVNLKLFKNISSVK